MTCNLTLQFSRELSSVFGKERTMKVFTCDKCNVEITKFYDINGNVLRQEIKGA